MEKTEVEGEYVHNFQFRLILKARLRMFSVVEGGEGNLEIRGKIFYQFYQMPWICLEEQQVLPKPFKEDNQDSVKQITGIAYQEILPHGLTMPCSLQALNPFCTVMHLHIHSGYYWEILYSLRN